MIAIGLLFVRMLCDCFKSRRQLEAEILVLRHQLSVLQQRAARRLHLRWADRALFIWLYRRCPRILDITIGQTRGAALLAGALAAVDLFSRLGGCRTNKCTASDQRSISPNTMSSEPMIAETSASMCPRVRKSIACKCANEGARILHLYGRLVPSAMR